MCFFLFTAKEDFMLADVPLFWFEYHMTHWQGDTYLCEVCVWWDGTVEIMEMVRIEAKNEHE